jgi:alkyl sulfatase BDS1-like metallo-beta-lactamase superfamily hydrolase
MRAADARFQTGGAMGVVLEFAEDLWTGRVSPEERHPFAPLFAVEEVGARTGFVSSFANVTAIDTDAGVLLVDTGGLLFGSAVVESVRRFSRAPVHAAVYTHGHVDHVCGTRYFDDEARAAGRPALRVLAHEAVPARFERYRLTRGYNGCINSRQFGAPVTWPEEYRFPDETYRVTLVIDVGGERVELHPARGETDDHTWVWMPSRKLLCTGDLFIWAAPNAGNPQKVQRYPREWAAALREMAALGAEVLCPGHGPPIVGAARARQALTETAELLETLHDQTVALMNEGARLDDVLQNVRAPVHLLERPYLRPIYDEPEFIVRNVWRLYGGWWDGNPAHLKPGPEARLAAEVASLAGGARRLIERANELAEAGELATAAQLAEWAVQAAPSEAAIARARAAIYARRVEEEKSLMARGIFRAAASEGGA